MCVRRAHRRRIATCRRETGQSAARRVREIARLCVLGERLIPPLRVTQIRRLLRTRRRFGGIRGEVRRRQKRLPLQITVRGIGARLVHRLLEVVDRLPRLTLLLRQIA